MFSARVPSTMDINRLAVAVDERRARGLPLCDLTETNPTAVGLRYPGEDLMNALADKRVLVYAPSPRGLEGARKAIARYYEEQHRVAVDPAHLFLTASTSESYSFLFKLLCNAGERVLVPQPSYPLFQHLAALDGVKAVPYPLRYHGGWFLELEELERRADLDTRAVLIVNPNNPTGHFIKRAELDRLHAICRAKKMALISDEVFADYAYAPDVARVKTLIGERDVLTFVLSGLSKPAGLPQMKLGWIHVGGPPQISAEAEQRLDLIADTYLSVSTAVQHAASKLLPLVDDVGRQILERVSHNRNHLRLAVRDSACQLLEAEGGWAAVLRVPAICTEEEWALTLLEQDGVLVHPGYFFDFEDEAFLVVSLLPMESEFQAGIAKLLRRVATA